MTKSLLGTGLLTVYIFQLVTSLPVTVT